MKVPGLHPWGDAVPAFVYRCYGGGEVLLYVGLTSKPDQRMGVHKSSRRSRRWIGDVATVRLTWFDNRTDAAVAEAEAIRLERPRFNVADHPDYVRAGRRGWVRRAEAS